MNKRKLVILFAIILIFTISVAVIPLSKSWSGTIYMTANTGTYNGVNGYILSSTASASEVQLQEAEESSIEPPTLALGFKFFVLHSNGATDELTSDVTTYTGDNTNSMEWSCPQTSMSLTDAIEMQIYYQYTAPTGTSWTLLATLVSSQLNSVSLNSATWDVLILHYESTGYVENYETYYNQWYVLLGGNTGTLSSIGSVDYTLGYTITSSCDAHSTISPLGSVAVASGGSQEFDYSASTGYHISQVLVDSSPINLETYPSSYTFSSVSSAHTISVSSSINTYTITVTSAHGSPTSSGSVNYGQNYPTSVTSPDYDGSSHRWVCTGYSIDGGSNISGTSYTFTSVSSSHSITYSWQEQFRITSSAGSSASINPLGDTWVNSGSSKSYSYSASTGYHISQVLVDGSSISLSTYPSIYTFSNILSAHTISVSSSINTYTIIPSHDSYSTITPSTSQTVNYGSSKSFSYSPATGCHLTNVFVDGIDKLGTNPTGYTFTSVSANHQIEVFGELDSDLLSSSLPSVSGTIANSSQTFSCLWDDDAFSLHGGGGFIFSTNNTGIWKNTTWSAFSTTPSWANVTQTLNQTVEYVIGYKWYANDSYGNVGSSALRTFSTDGYVITPLVDSYSHIDPNATQTVCAGANVEFSFTVDDGHDIQSVIIDSVYQVSTVSPYTFSNIQTDHSIAISTSDVIYFVNATSDSGCAIVPSGLYYYAYGTQAHFSCNPVGGYQIYNLYVNGVGVGAVSSYDFYPSENTTLYLVSMTISGPSQTGGGGSSYYTPIQESYLLSNNPSEEETIISPISVEILQRSGAIILIVIAVLFAYGVTAGIGKNKKKKNGWNL